MIEGHAVTLFELGCLQEEREVVEVVIGDVVKLQVCGRGRDG